MAIEKRDDTGNSKRKHYIVLSGEFAFEEAMNMLQERETIQ